MTDKAYIVANEEQEREVLEKLEQEAVTWWLSLKQASQFIPSKYSPFPYGLKILGSYVVFASLDRLEGYEIVFDGRKEEQMSDKYVVSQEFMNELGWWETYWNVAPGEYVDNETTLDLFNRTKSWWVDYKNSNEQNNRLIAIIRWVNGEDVFEVEKQKKWVVHELNTELYVTTYDGHTGITPNRDYITKFDTKEEAESWANAHQEVVEVEE